MIQEIYLITASLVALTAAFVRVQIMSSNNAKNHTELKTEMIKNSDKQDQEINNKVDKLEKAVFERMETIQDHIKTIEDKMNETKIEVVEIKLK